MLRSPRRRRTRYQTGHSFAGNALEAGESPSRVGAYAGHTTTALLVTTYNRWIKSRTRHDASALAARIAETGNRAAEVGAAIET